MTAPERSNIRAYLPRQEAAKLLAILQEVERWKATEIAAPEKTSHERSANAGRTITKPGFTYGTAKPLEKQP